MMSEVLTPSVVVGNVTGMKRTERIQINFLTATMAELKVAERKQARLENAGYVLVSHHGNIMKYRLES